MSDKTILESELASHIRGKIYFTRSKSARVALLELARDLCIDLDHERLKRGQNRIWSKFKAKNSRRRAEQHGLTDHFTPEQWLNLIQFYNNQCVFCPQNKTGLTVDHVIPLAEGGQNVIENIQPLCRTCRDFFDEIGLQKDHRSTLPDWFDLEVESV